MRRGEADLNRRVSIFSALIQFASTIALPSVAFRFARTQYSSAFSVSALRE